MVKIREYFDVGDSRTITEETFLDSFEDAYLDIAVNLNRKPDIYQRPTNGLTTDTLLSNGDININTNTLEVEMLVEHDTATSVVWTQISGGSPAASVSFLAYLSTTASNVTGDGSTYQVVFDTPVFNNGSAYNPATGVFTAPVTGLYQCNAGAYFSASSNHSDTFIQDFMWNTTAYRGSEIPSTQGVALASSGILVNMLAGDTVTIQISQGGGTKTTSIMGLNGSEILTMFSGSRVA